MGGAEARYTLEAAERLRSLERPTLLAWSREYQLFPARHAEQLAELLPNARLEWIEDSYPGSCPGGGAWVNRARFTYRDDVTQREATRSPCER